MLVMFTVKRPSAALTSRGSASAAQHRVMISATVAHQYIESRMTIPGIPSSRLRSFFILFYSILFTDINPGA